MYQELVDVELDMETDKPIDVDFNEYPDMNTDENLDVTWIKNFF